MAVLLRKSKSRKAVVRSKEFSEAELKSRRRDDAVGWAKLPRYIMALLWLLRSKAIVGSVDCAGVYLELLSRDYGDGVIETGDPVDHAFNAGFFGARAARSWKERVAKLVEVGAVIAKEKNGRPYGYLLLVDPDLVVHGLAGKTQEKHEAELVQSYWRMREEVGGDSEDRRDLRLAKFIHRVLKAGGVGAGAAPKTGPEGRLYVMENEGKAVAALDNLAPDEVFACVEGMRTKTADALMAALEAAEKWEEVKKDYGVDSAGTVKRKALAGGAS
jgi:hypothetical protein